MNSNKSHSFIDSLLWILIAVKKHLTIVLLVSVLIGAGSIALALNLEEEFECTVTVTPPSSDGMGGMKDAMGKSGLANVIGMDFSGSEQANALWGIINSRDIQFKIIEKFNLIDHYEMNSSQKIFMADALKAFRKNFEMEENDEDFFVLSFRDKDPKMAYEIIKFYLKVSDSAYNEFVLQKASKELKFFKERIAELKKEMSDLENLFISFQKENKLVDPEVQLESTMKILGELEADLEKAKLNRVVEQKIYGTKTLRYEEFSKRVRILSARLQGFRKNGSNSGTLLGLNKSPEIVAEYYRLEREMKIQQLLYKYLRQNFEEYKLMAANMDSKIQIVEQPWLNDKRVAPSRSAIVLVIGFFGLIFSIFIAVLMQFYKEEKIKNSSRYQKMKELFSLRK